MDTIKDRSMGMGRGNVSSNENTFFLPLMRGFVVFLWVLLFLAVLWAIYYPTALLVAGVDEGGSWTTGMFIATIAAILGAFVAAAFVLVFVTFVASDSQFEKGESFRFRGRQGRGFLHTIVGNGFVVLLWIVLPLLLLAVAGGSLIVSLIISNLVSPFEAALFFPVPLIVFTIVGILVAGYKLFLLLKKG